MTQSGPDSGPNEEEILKHQERLFAELDDIFNKKPEIDANSPIGLQTGDSNPTKSDLFEFYHTKLSIHPKPRAVYSDWKWLEGVKSVMDDIDACFETVDEAIHAIDEQKKGMARDLSGLDEKSRQLLLEQRALEKEVAELDLKMNSINVIKDVSVLVNNRDMLVANFPKFRSIVESLTSVSADARQYEHLKSRVCSVAVSVGMSAIDIYSKRMMAFLDDQQGSTVSSVSLYGKFTETLTVVGNIAKLFRAQSERDFSQAITELERGFVDVRERIIVPVLGDFNKTSIASLSLSKSIRKSVLFANSIAKQEASFFDSLFSQSRQSDSTSDSLQSLFGAVGLALYQPVRTAVISSDDLGQLRESAEIIRLEILTADNNDYYPFIQAVVTKLHRDIQERLIYRVESFIRDEIKGFTTWVKDDISNGLPPPPVRKTYECLDLITGVVDSQTFHEIANEAVIACVQVLPGVRTVTPPLFESSEDAFLFLIVQLLSLRERITVIDCEYSLLAVTSPLEHRGLTDQIRKLVTSGPSLPGRDVPVRTRIESELKARCDEFNAAVIARAIGLGSNDERTTYLESLRERMKTRLTSESGLDVVLLRPIVAELKRMNLCELELSREHTSSTAKPDDSRPQELNI